MNGGGVVYAQSSTESIKAHHDVVCLPCVPTVHLWLLWDGSGGPLAINVAKRYQKSVPGLLHRTFYYNPVKQLCPKVPQSGLN